MHRDAWSFTTRLAGQWWSCATHVSSRHALACHLLSYSTQRRCATLHEPPIGDSRRLASQRSISMPLNVIHAVRKVAACDQETPATVAHRMHDGQVRLCGDLARAMMDQPSTMHPPTCGPTPS